MINYHPSHPSDRSKFDVRNGRSKTKRNKQPRCDIYESGTILFFLFQKKIT